MASKVDRAKQALTHIKLAVIAMEDLGVADIVDDLRGIYRRIQAVGKGG